LLITPGLVKLADQIPLAVQVVPHITDAIQEGIERVANTPVDDSGEAPDVCIGK
jgi:CTP synthase